MKIDTLTIKEYMDVKLISDEFGNNIPEYTKRIVNYFSLDKKLKKKEGDELIDSLVIILNGDVGDFIQRFIYKGVEYGFIPDLNDITTGEYIDLEEYMKTGDRLDKIMTILYRPIIDKDKKGNYLIEEYNGTDKSSIMLGVDFKIAQSALFFFTSLRTSLLRASRIYTQVQKKQLVKLKLRKNNNLQKSLGGILCFIPRLMKAFYKLRKLRKERHQNS